jgi:hypothetical protein
VTITVLSKIGMIFVLFPLMIISLPSIVLVSLVFSIVIPCRIGTSSSSEIVMLFVLMVALRSMIVQVRFRSESFLSHPILVLTPPI